jgi:hypothetical protein
MTRLKSAIIPESKIDFLMRLPPFNIGSFQPGKAGFQVFLPLHNRFVSQKPKQVNKNKKNKKFQHRRVRGFGAAEYFHNKDVGKERAQVGNKRVVIH